MRFYSTAELLLSPGCPRARFRGQRTSCCFNPKSETFLSLVVKENQSQLQQ